MQAQSTSRSDSASFSTHHSHTNTPIQIPPTPDSPRTLVNSMSAPVRSETASLVRLLASMKASLEHCDTAFDVLSNTTLNIANVAPATQDMAIVDELKEQVNRHVEEQRRNINQVEQLLKQELRNTYFESLERSARQLIEQAIAKVIETRVQEEIEARIPAQIREWSQTHNMRMLHVDTELQNAQARMHNSTLVHTESLREPLRPLLRPLPTPAQSPAYAAGTRTIFTAPTTPFTPSMGSPAWEDVTRPAPSTNFPRTLEDIQELSPQMARSLAEEYHLTPISGNETPTREDDINLFLKHIGMPAVKVIPPPQITNGTKATRAMLPPLIIAGR